MRELRLTRTKRDSWKALQKRKIKTTSTKKIKYIHWIVKEMMYICYNQDYSYSGMAALFLKRILRLNVKIVKYEIVSNFVLKYVQSCVMVMKGYKGMEKAIFSISFFL